MRNEIIEELKRFYDEKADLYFTSYTGEGRYPSNKYRLEIVLNLVEKSRGSRILDAGCGSGVFVLSSLKNGYDCYGFDISEEMIKRAKKILGDNGFDPDRVSIGDIYNMSFDDNSFDKVVVLGVLQHLPEHEKIFEEIHRVLIPGGDLIISLDNSLFSIFSLNKYTINFLKKVLSHYDIPKQLIDDGLNKYGELIQVDKAVSMRKVIKTYEELENIGSKLYDYNPLNVADQFSSQNFKVLDVRFYHYHPLPPRFENQFYDLFNTIAQKMESIEYDWRGAILCNQFVVRAQSC